MKKIPVSKADYWKRIGLISFVLAVFIMIRHNSSFYNYNIPSGESFHLYLKDTITALAVPMFFIISGLNFYRNYTPDKQIEKLKNRAKSLVVPYFAWNTIFCAFVLITSNTAISRFFIGREKYALTIPNIIFGCIYHWNCNSQFWFVFDLMLIALLNPLFYYLLKNKWVGLITLAAGYIAIFLLRLELPLAFVYRTDAFFYYLIGAYVAMHLVEFSSSTEEIEARNIKRTVVGILLIALSFLMGISSFPYALQPFIILPGCYGLWLVSGAFSDKELSWVPSGGTVFLFYAAHGIIQPVVVKLLYLALPKNPWVSIVNFILAITLTIFICIFMRKLMKKYCSTMDHILCGWRK